MSNSENNILPPLPKASKMYDIPGYDEEELKSYARAAVEADRQSRNCGQCVPLSTDGKSVFIDGVGEVPLDFGGQARGEPVAWYTDNHLTDKSATTWDRTVAARWRGKRWPVGELFAALQPQQIPEGYKLVPIDPTQEMLFAGDTEFGKRKIPSISGICYKAMLEAAPEPANPGREVEK